MKRMIYLTWLPLLASAAVAAAAEKEMPVKTAQGKRVVMIVAQQGFRDEEFAIPHERLTRAGVTVTVAASQRGTAKGALGASISVSTPLREVRIGDADGVIFVGGAGAQVYFNDPSAHALAREAAESGKILAAICIAPATLANAGVLNGKKAACFPSVEPILKEGGANLSRQPVVRDGNIITANGPAAAPEFAQAILDALAGRVPESP